MNDSQKQETLPHVYVRCWAEGKITESAYRQISRHQSKRNNADAQAMLAEWILD